MNFLTKTLNIIYTTTIATLTVAGVAIGTIFGVKYYFFPDFSFKNIR